MSSIQTEEPSALESIPNRSHRYPRKWTVDEIENMPKLRFAEGMDSAITISAERDDAMYFSQGFSFHTADCETLGPWQQVNWDEALFCVKGQLYLIAEDKHGKQVEFRINEGEHMYLPAGYAYTLKASGVESINFWTTAPQPKSGWRYGVSGAASEYSGWLREQR